MTSTKNNGGDIITEKYISLSDLRKVRGIGDKTIERIKAQLLQSELDNNYKCEYNPHIKLDINEIYQGDCLELMNGIPDKSVDMILCDLPYGTTACKWDAIIPFEPLWKQYERVIKDNGAIVLTASQPFTTKLINSNINLFKYELIWKKERPTNPLMCKKQFPKYHENICIFYKKQPTFNPQYIKRKEKNKRNNKPRNYADNTKVITDKYSEMVLSGNNDYIYQPSILEVPMERGLHPTQKPVKLLELLIKTYTNQGDLVLDNCIGSGSTAIACINTNRNYIGIELDENYYNIAKNRIYEHKKVVERSQKRDKYEK